MIVLVKLPVGLGIVDVVRGLQIKGWGIISLVHDSLSKELIGEEDVRVATQEVGRVVLNGVKDF